MKSWILREEASQRPNQVFLSTTLWGFSSLAWPGSLNKRTLVVLCKLTWHFLPVLGPQPMWGTLSNSFEKGLARLFKKWNEGQFSNAEISWSRILCPWLSRSPTKEALTDKFKPCPRSPSFPNYSRKSIHFRMLNEKVDQVSHSLWESVPQLGIKLKLNLNPRDYFSTPEPWIRSKHLSALLDACRW